ncbi:MAG TPA: cation-transporting P-type ATPase [Candidatus Baltobacteraceae bacterium]|nr:cation-transporting P-type ATPase [Candidatus Baltobacteraceae bacterium]
MPLQPLSEGEARERLGRFGPNILVPEGRHAALTWVLRFVTDPMVLLLALAGGTYAVLGERFDAIVALGALVPIFLIGAVLEHRSEAALKALKNLALPTARVRRGSEERVIDARGVVPGDVLLVQEGDVFVADGILAAGTDLLVDESPLTGESQPVLKETQSGELYAGTSLRSGRGEMLVTATGTATRYGRIGKLLSEMHPGATPIEEAIHRLVRQIGAAVIVLCAVVILVEHARGALWAAAVIAGVSLAMAAIPEEMPMVYTLYLALGAWRLARQRALVRRLASVETLGSANVICVDKTGTLTQGRLDVAAVWPYRSSQAQVLTAAVLASEARAFDPLDAAVLKYARAHGTDTSMLDRGVPEVSYAFDAASRRITQIWRTREGMRVAVKGAVENVLALCTLSEAQRREIADANEAFAREGMRVIAVAEGTRPSVSDLREQNESNLDFRGLLAFSDPVREDVPEAIRTCKRAGIEVIMITGDHPATAQATARLLGLRSTRTITGPELESMSEHDLAQALSGARVFARIQPEQKLRIVKALHARGDVVAMTGDGTNDALALREADIGVAMGKHGTDVARAAADLVLLDDDFATIVAAIAGGRRIFKNLRRAFRYLNAFHTPLILSAIVVPFFGVPLLLLPVHLVWLELIVHPTSALVYENESTGADGTMSERPRGRASALLRGTDWIRPLLLGVTLSAGCLAAYLWALGHGYPAQAARGMALAAMISGQMLLVLTERSLQLPIWKQRFLENRRLVPILAGTAAMLIAMLYVPALSAVFRVAAPAPAHLGAAFGIAALTTLWLEPFKRPTFDVVHRR